LRKKSARPNHKRECIERILQTYPGLEFVLIGDSGEEDPEIYSEVLRRYPDRICVVYIRSVDPSPSRIAAIEKLIREVASTGCQLVLAPDTQLAAVHAAAEGLIKTSDLREIRAECKADALSDPLPPSSPPRRPASPRKRPHPPAR
jgi:phosphatidate phosphatase APP1